MCAVVPNLILLTKVLGGFLGLNERLPYLPLAQHNVVNDASLLRDEIRGRLRIEPQAEALGLVVAQSSTVADPGVKGGAKLDHRGGGKLDH